MIPSIFSPPTVVLVEEDMVFVEHEEHWSHPLDIAILPLDLLDQSNTRWLWVHLLHDSHKLSLELFLGWRAAKTNGVQLVHLWHVDLSPEDLVHERDGDYAWAVRRHEEALADEKLIKGLLVRQVGVDLLLNRLHGFLKINNSGLGPDLNWESRGSRQDLAAGSCLNKIRK